MARLRFTLGVRYLNQGQLYIVRQLLAEHRFAVENQSFGGQKIVTQEELVEEWAQGNLRFEVVGPNAKQTSDAPLATSFTFADFEHLPPNQRDEAWRRYQLILPLLRLQPKQRTRQYLEAYAEQVRQSSADSVTVQSPRSRGAMGEAVSRSSLERWLGAFMTGGFDINSLVPGTYRCGNIGQHRLDQDCERIVTAVLAECAANSSYRTNYDVYLMVVNRIAEENRFRTSDTCIKRPGEATIYRRIQEAGSTTILRRRASRKEAQADAPVKPGPNPTRILERVEIDHTQLDIFLVDEEDRFPIGRPTLTFALDVATGFPLGFYVGFEPPSYFTVMQCLLHSILPKADTCQQYGTQNGWLSYGLPETLIIDNGKEFIGRDLADASAQLGIILERMPVKCPWFKGPIERFFRTNNTGLIHPLPGTSFSNIVERGDYDVFQHACISLTAFWRLLHIFLLDFYAQRWHKGIGGIPAKRWAENMQAGFIPALHHGANDMRILLARADTRTVGRAGIEFEMLSYNSPDLQRMRQLLSKDDREVRIKYDPGDLGAIHVYDTTAKGGAWLRVPTTDQDYAAGISLWQHRVVRRYVRSQQKEVDIEALAAAKAHIQQIVAREFVLTRKSRGRKSAARFLGITPDPTSALPTPERVSPDNIHPSRTAAAAASGKDKSGRPNKSAPGAKEEARLGESDAHSTTSSIPDAAPDDLDTSGWGGDYNLPPSGRQ
jgi:putative transposase